MDFSESFSAFYQKAKESLADGTFAKLTLAKTIGNTELMNVYVWPVVVESELNLELRFRFQREEIVEAHKIDAAFERLLEFINNPFLSAILFTTQFDLVYKLNKKRAVSVTEQPPTFANPSEVLTGFLNQ